MCNGGSEDLPTINERARSKRLPVGLNDTAGG